MTTHLEHPLTVPALQVSAELLQEFTPLPESVVRLVALLDDPTVSLPQVAAVAAHDVALTSDILRLANSALYGAPQHIGTITDAVRTIGLNQVRLLVITGGVGRLRQRALPCYDLPAAAFSRHSELVASLALFLARAIGYRDPGVAYTAGLLHDVGKVALDQLGQQARWSTSPMNVAARRGLYSMEEAEQAFCGQTHAQLGQRLAERWALPAEIAAAIGAHHTWEGGPADNPLAWCVAVANMVASASDPDYPRTARAATALLVDPALRDAAEVLAREVLQAPEEEMSDWAIVHAVRARQRVRGAAEASQSVPVPAPSPVDAVGRTNTRERQSSWVRPVVLLGVVLVVLAVVATAVVLR